VSYLHLGNLIPAITKNDFLVADPTRGDRFKGADLRFDFGRYVPRKGFDKGYASCRFPSTIMKSDDPIIAKKFTWVAVDADAKVGYILRFVSRDGGGSAFEDRLSAVLIVDLAGGAAPLAHLMERIIDGPAAGMAAATKALVSV